MRKIPIDLVVGESATAKQTLLHYWQQAQFTPQSISLNITHASSISLQSACLCCRMHNETSEKLRAAFMQALQKQIPVFSSVLLNCDKQVQSRQIIYTLGQDFFLKERFFYEASILVLDRQDIAVLAHYTESKQDSKTKTKTKTIAQEDKATFAQLYPQLSEASEVSEASALSPYLHYLSATDLIVLVDEAESMSSILELKQTQANFLSHAQEVLFSLYAQLSFFNTAQHELDKADIPDILLITELSAEKIAEYKQNWQQRHKRAPVLKKHSLFFY